MLGQEGSDFVLGLTTVYICQLTDRGGSDTRTVCIAQLTDTARASSGDGTGGGVGGSGSGTRTVCTAQLTDVDRGVGGG